MEDAVIKVMQTIMGVTFDLALTEIGKSNGHFDKIYIDTGTHLDVFLLGGP